MDGEKYIPQDKADSGFHYKSRSLCAESPIREPFSELLDRFPLQAGYVLEEHIVE